jgi:hypothetical protein
MMANGNILMALGQTLSYEAPTYFNPYNYRTSAFTEVHSPTGGSSYNLQTYLMVFLDLLDGTVLFSPYNSQLYVYKPGGADQPEACN